MRHALLLGKAATEGAHGLQARIRDHLCGRQGLLRRTQNTTWRRRRNRKPQSHRSGTATTGLFFRLGLSQRPALSSSLFLLLSFPLAFVLSGVSFPFAFALLRATRRPRSFRSLVAFSFRLSFLAFSFALGITTTLVSLTLPAPFCSVSLLPAVVAKLLLESSACRPGDFTKSKLFLVVSEGEPKLVPALAGPMQHHVLPYFGTQTL